MQMPHCSATSQNSRLPHGCFCAILSEHTAYLAANIPRATLVTRPGASHFAPPQRPTLFNDAVLAFLNRIGS